MWCGNKNDLKVHHRHLETMGRENIITDLSVFCRLCLKRFGPDSKVVLDEKSPPKTQTELRKRVQEIRTLKDGKE